MSWIIVQQENERQLDTIRARVIERSNWRQDSVWNVDRRFRRMSESPEWCGTHKDVRSVGNWVAEVGLEYFCLDYVSKNGVSVTECNSMWHPILQFYYAYDHWHPVPGPLCIWHPIPLCIWHPVPLCTWSPVPLCIWHPIPLYIWSWYGAQFHYAYEAPWGYAYEIPLGFAYVGNASVGLSCSAYISLLDYVYIGSRGFILCIWILFFFDSLSYFIALSYLCNKFYFIYWATAFVAIPIYCLKAQFWLMLHQDLQCVAMMHICEVFSSQGVSYLVLAGWMLCNDLKRTCLWAYSYWMQRGHGPSMLQYCRSLVTKVRTLVHGDTVREAMECWDWGLWIRLTSRIVTCIVKTRRLPALQKPEDTGLRFWRCRYLQMGTHTHMFEPMLSLS